ncbi:MAG: hypothetical protein JWM35_633, partial [Verrucomicrobia bacterium]|nr:hypothetical protein [Verrucomicrobiota bacterium]
MQVRKRLKKSTDELHAFENIDAPAYESWLHRTFPVSLTALRELSEELITKSAKVAAVELQVMMEGGNPRRHWRELNAEESRRRNDPAFDFGDKDNPGNRKRARHSFGSDPAAEFFDEDLDENLPWGESPKASPVGEGARDVYRRLVQRLHPDRGGEWTAARKRLWHEVQEAWAAGDFDWLARLEVEWDST